MLEATPGKPWGIGFKDLLDVEQNMKLRWLSLRFSFERTLISEQAEDCKGAHG